MAIKKRLGSLLGPQGLPGQPGEPGEQGLPGPNAIPADEAVAAYLQDTSTQTRTAANTVANKAIEPVASVATAPRTPYPKSPKIKWLNTFQATTGLSNPFGDNDIIIPNTEDYFMGTQSVDLTLNGSSGAMNVPTGGIDLTGRGLVLWAKIVKANSSAILQVYAGNTTLSSFLTWNLGRLGAQSPLMRVGEWGLYYIDPYGSSPTTVGTPDITNISTIRVRLLHSTTDETLRVQAVGFYEKIDKFPNGYCAITFDDGYWSDYEAAQRSFSPRGIPATSFVIPDLIGTGNKMTVDHLHEMRDRHHWDIQAHGLYSYPSRTPEQMRAEFTQTKQWFAEHGFHLPDHLAYVGGQTNDMVVDTAKEFFTSARTIVTGTEVWPPSMPHRVSAISSISDYPGGTSVQTVKDYIDMAVEHGMVVILVFHRIVDEPTSAVECSWAALNEVLDYVIASGIEVGTYADMWK